ncbi:MAG: cytochrome c biogenesis protein CcsA [Candidatus Thermoplasmatota archaeon]|nr:cytochrome c biogenesis protein CcsA [Candidatus Thermoplasmatota archaeon]
MVHELSSTFIYVHPPLAIAGYAFIALTLFSTASGSRHGFLGRNVQKFAFLSWLFTFLGLVTGMMWASIAWGRFWGWDPKETMTLVLFMTVFFRWHFGEKRRLGGGDATERNRLLQWSLISTIMVIVTISTSFWAEGLHSYVGL